MFSKTVACALSYFNFPETGATKKFVEIFDRFFDCLNVRNRSEHYEKKKPDLKPYTSAKDERLLVSLLLIV